MITNDIKPVCPHCKKTEPKLVGYVQDHIDNIDNRLVLLLCQSCNAIITAVTIADAYEDHP